jgi:hypothetical protein
MIPAPNSAWPRVCDHDLIAYKTQIEARMAPIRRLPELNPGADFASERAAIFKWLPSIGILEIEEASDPVELSPAEGINV